MWNATFRLLTTSLLRAMGLTGCGTALCIMVVCCDWCISIRLLFPCTKVSPRRSLVLVQIFSYCGHPRFRYFGSVVPVYVFALSLMWIGEIGRPLQERMKEHDGYIRLARTQNSAVSEHANGTGYKPLWNETKFIDRGSHWYTKKVKEAIHMRLNLRKMMFSYCGSPQ